jgi:hypothetical protein
LLPGVQWQKEHQLLNEHKPFASRGHQSSAQPAAYCIRNATHKSAAALLHVPLLPLCREAARLDAAALVMYSQGKDRLMDAMLGSVSSYCLHHSPVPLVLLHA